MALSLPALAAGCFALWLLSRRLSLYMQHRRFQQLHECRPPPALPQYDTILGIDLMLENFRSWKADQLLDRMQSRFQRVGNTYSAKLAGQRITFTVEPENIKAIFADQFNDFDIGYIRRRAIEPSIGDMLLTADGSRWHQQRAMLRPAFNRQQYSDFAFYERDIDELIRAIPCDGSTIDLAPLFHIHALNLASRLLFDEPMATLNPDFPASSNRIIEALRRVNRGTEHRLRMGRLLPFMPRDRAYDADCRVSHEYGDMIVQKALSYKKSLSSSGVEGDEETEGRYVFLRQLAKEVDDPVELRNQLLGMQMAGSETTAGLLTTCLSLLSDRPGSWAKLRKEALELGVPTSEGVRSFVSLNHFVNEVLRLYPVVPIYGRMANKDTTLPRGGGPDGNSRVFIPKGSTAMITAYSLHRRADIWGDDSHEFRPERWQSMKPKNWSYLPFSAGPRVCIGREY
ncbi:MAG: hypothetical protein Q9198_000126 [Flavoplaca austrocitrina]